ncbi:hypothetical protein Cs7R123_29980 [Catellatospora sp. TT07R-123]|nr:hypothetical protein Cs7R123_29980 [Catellatospora sp. TT07R-123]
MNRDLKTVLVNIANALGVPQSDVEADHGRWHLYERVIESSNHLDLLRKAVALEEDTTLATSVVLRMLELVTDDQQDDWIVQLAPNNRAYSQRRAGEIRILRRARVGAVYPEEIASQVGDWTDWLQLRLVENLGNRASLAILSDQGRTKRIRNSAAQRLRALIN